MALVITPLMIAGYFAGLPYGPKGVAAAYSALMMMWMIPAIVWCVRDTVISIRDVLLVASWPMISSIVAAGIAFAVQALCGQNMSSLARLLMEGIIMVVVYISMLLFVAGQKSFYLEILRGLKGTTSAEEKNLVSV
jgi:PST family polysaccharide transporter